MSHLKKRATRIHQKLGTAGFIIACLALVAALGGTALAAKGLFTKAQEKKIAAIAKKVAKGVQGPQGLTGPTGPAGSQGEKGPKGDKGEPGNNGTSVTSTPIPAGASEPCGEAGGVAYTSASGTENVCNGKEGSPWTAGGTLPSEKTETGTWSVSAPATPQCSGTPCGEITLGQETELIAPISFPIPLAQSSPTKEVLLDAQHVVYVGFGEVFQGHGHYGNVPGTSPAVSIEEVCPSKGPASFGGGVEPFVEAKAAPGYLCVYEGALGSKNVKTEATPSSYPKAEALIEIPSRPGALIAGAGAEGAVLRLFAEGEQKHWAAGVWAVTAP